MIEDQHLYTYYQSMFKSHAFINQFCTYIKNNVTVSLKEVTKALSWNRDHLHVIYGPYLQAWLLADISKCVLIVITHHSAKLKQRHMSGLSYAV